MQTFDAQTAPPTSASSPQENGLDAVPAWSLQDGIFKIKQLMERKGSMELLVLAGGTADLKKAGHTEAVALVREKIRNLKGPMLDVINGEVLELVERIYPVLLDNQFSPVVKVVLGPELSDRTPGSHGMKLLLEFTTALGAADCIVAEANMARQTLLFVKTEAKTEKVIDTFNAMAILVRLLSDKGVGAYITSDHATAKYEAKDEGAARRRSRRRRRGGRVPRDGRDTRGREDRTVLPRRGRPAHAADRPVGQAEAGDAI